MDKQLFRQRMRNLKSYRGNNPGKGYWDWKVLSFEDGGEVKDPPISKTTRDIVYDYEDNLRKIDKIGKRPLEEGLSPVFNLEDAANFTPIGDAISVKDTYNAVKERDWLGASLGVASMLPFVPRMARKNKWAGREIPEVSRSFERKVDAIDRNERKIVEEYINLRNRAYELMNTPEARRRAKAVDDKYGTRYQDVYDSFIDEYEDIDSYLKMPEPKRVSEPNAYATVNPDLDEAISLSKENITNPSDFPDGLIRHEIGHIVDNYAARGGIGRNNYLRNLGDPKKYVPSEKAGIIFNKSVDPMKRYNYLTTPTETKNIMTQFLEYLLNNYDPITYPSNFKLFKESIIKAPSTLEHMKDLLKIHVKPANLYKDFMNVPLVSTSNNKELV